MYIVRLIGLIKYYTSLKVHLMNAQKAYMYIKCAVSDVGIMFHLVTDRQVVTVWRANY